ncbi:MAG: glycosyltransferase family 4 protein [Chloroflexota bacterium]|nr:glycosyltransferase family 4 protein [Chloroflexota bacterium]
MSSGSVAGTDWGENRVRVGINARLLSGEPGVRQAGIGRYLDRLIAALPEALGPGDEMVILGQPAPPGESAARRVVWEQAVLPRHARRAALSLLHAPVNVAPLAAPCPTVVTVHDLAFFRLPDVVPAGRRRYLAAMTRVSVSRAAGVLAVSEHTARDAVELLGVPPGRITVTPLGVDPWFRPTGADALAAFRAERGLDRPFILAVGTLEPRKGMTTLLRAFGRVASSVPHDLVLVGATGWMNESFDRTLAGLPGPVRERVRQVGFVPAADLPPWYGAASLFAYPSLYEGFGLPVLEAMACGTPVITSAVSALPETAGEAALLVPPGDAGALADALGRLLDDPVLAVDLSGRGLARAALFPWSRTAEATVAAYRAALGDSGRRAG